MDEEVKEYTTFHVTSKDGQNLEMAVMDEFEFEHKNYVVGALVEGDTINEDGFYIYHLKMVKDEICIEKILNAVDYERIAKAYMELED